MLIMPYIVIWPQIQGINGTTKKENQTQKYYTKKKKKSVVFLYLVSIVPLVQQS